MDPTVFDTNSVCNSRFLSLLAAAEEAHHPLRTRLLDEFDKYSLWADNVGAIHPPSSSRSLDHRLRHASSYKQETIRILEIVAEQLSDHEQWLTGGTPGAPPNLESDKTSTRSGSSDSPWDVSSDSEPEAEPTKITAMPSAAEPSHSQSHALLDATSYAIKCLFSLPLRKPAPMDRLQNRVAENREPSAYTEFDLRYVRDKFPLLDAAVQERLGRLVTKRRDLLRYRQSHSERLEAKREAGSAPPLGGMFRAEADKPTIPLTIQLGTDGISATESTKATTVLPDARIPDLKVSLGPDLLPSTEQSPLANPDVDDDARTSVVGSEATREIKIKVPPLPRQADGTAETPFKCEYCYIPVIIRSEKAWRDHVFGDLQPFVCTYPDCHLEAYLFDSADAWFLHETQCHRLEFFCGASSHATHLSMVSFRKHLAEAHGMEHQTNSDDDLRLFQRPARSLRGTCNLCDTYTSDLKRHVSRHLRQVALFAIPRADYHARDEVEGSAQAMQPNESHLSTNSSSTGADSQHPQQGEPVDATEETADSVTEPEPSEPLATEPSFWEDISTYGVVDARAGRADPPPDGVGTNQPHNSQSSFATSRTGKLQPSSSKKGKGAVKRRTRSVWVWICCTCGRSGLDMVMLTEQCLNKSCCHARCVNCNVRQVRQSR
ncbi:hypothetical protein B0T14DRAFT_274438 [Immersiella caudata]|uniref:Oxidoreductase acuF-like C2H2 type zinc-finger domain-containing protein n=1 Tax=Immersiella caudata TaxID=314043 RepID=A0AA39WLP0_9PEZI|nr:hypothetical protein B0T14DRAFT_274438 [Immersiella caudata]